MERRTVQLRLGGQTYRVVTSASDTELRALSEVVAKKLDEVTPKGRTPSPQAMLLAAMSLANDVVEERARRESLERRTRDVLRRVLVRVDNALEPLEDADSDAGD